MQEEQFCLILDSEKRGEGYRLLNESETNDHQRVLHVDKMGILHNVEHVFEKCWKQKEYLGGVGSKREVEKEYVGTQLFFRWAKI